MELDSQIAALCAQANSNPHQPYPTFALAMRLFDDPAWDILSPERPLRADERIVNYVKGLNYLDDRLIPLLTLLEVAEPELTLPPSQQAIVEKATRYLQQLASSSGAKTCSKKPYLGLGVRRVLNKPNLICVSSQSHGMHERASELESVRGKLGLPVERGRWFKPCRLSEIRAKVEKRYQRM
jgi:hypothetical protein